MQPINWKCSYGPSKLTRFCPWTAWTERFSTLGCQGHRSKLLTFFQGQITFWITCIQCWICHHQFRCGQGTQNQMAPVDAQKSHCRVLSWGSIWVRCPQSHIGIITWRQRKGAWVCACCSMKDVVWSCRASWSKSLTCALLSTLCGYVQAVYKLCHLPLFSDWLV